MIIGNGGAGKSTLARKLHQITGLPLIHMDQHFWQANWVDRDRLEWKAFVEEQTEREEWIMDGNYGGTMDIRLKKADTIIFLDRPNWLCIWRIIKRRLIYTGRTRPDMAEGCKERLTWAFVKYVFSYHKTRKPGILAKLATVKESQEVYILRNNKQIRNFLKEV